MDTKQYVIGSIINVYAYYHYHYYYYNDVHCALVQTVRFACLFVYRLDIGTSMTMFINLLSYLFKVRPMQYL